MNNYYMIRQKLQDEIRKIPKKNRSKFNSDYYKLIQLAQREDYEDIEIDRIRSGS